MDRKQLIQFPIKVALEAGKAIMEIYNNSHDIEIITKDDDSPLTRADQASNEVINSYLSQLDIPIISEENKQIPYEERKNWEICWIVDPLDGTKEFIKRNGEFTVNIALCKKGTPIFGVIYVPVTGELYYNDPITAKAFKTVVDKNQDLEAKLFRQEDILKPADAPRNSIKIVGSRSHMNPETEEYIQKMKAVYDHVEIVSIGSSLKFCMVAEGKAHVYPRFAPTMEWDTAAGSAIVEASGLEVIDKESGNPLRYNRENLLNPHFLVTR